MNIKIFALIGVLGITIPAIAMSKTTFNLEKNELKTDERQNILEDSKTNADSDQIKLNSEQINSNPDKVKASPTVKERGTVNERLRTFELDRADGNCRTTEANIYAEHNIFEGFCYWKF